MRNLIASFKYAIDGILHTIKHERNFRIHIVAMITVYYLSRFYNFTRDEMVLLNISICLVLFGELLNTAIETLVDLVTQDYHHLAKKAKDVAAGAVLINACIAVASGIFLFGKESVIQNIWQNFNSTIWNYVALIIYILICVLFVRGRRAKKSLKKVKRDVRQK